MDTLDRYLTESEAGAERAYRRAYHAEYIQPVGAESLGRPRSAPVLE